MNRKPRVARPVRLSIHVPAPPRIPAESTAQVDEQRAQERQARDARLALIRQKATERQKRIMGT